MALQVPSMVKIAGHMAVGDHQGMTLVHRMAVPADEPQLPPDKDTVQVIAAEQAVIVCRVFHVVQGLYVSRARRFSHRDGLGDSTAWWIPRLQKRSSRHGFEHEPSGMAKYRTGPITAKK